MLFPIAAITLFAAANASPVDFGDGDDALAWPNFASTNKNFAADYAASVDRSKAPVLSKSKVFVLNVHVTDKKLDQNPSIEGYTLYAARDGYASSFVSMDQATQESKNTFPSYLRATEEQARKGQGFLSTDLSKFYHPFSFELKNSTTVKGLSVVRQDNEDGTPGLTLNSWTHHVSELKPHKFLACNETVYGSTDRYGLVLRHLDTKIDKKIPAKCTPIRLFPECVNFDDIYEKRKKNAALAPLARCYKKGADFSKIH